MRSTLYGKKYFSRRGETVTHFSKLYKNNSLVYNYRFHRWVKLRKKRKQGHTDKLGSDKIQEEILIYHL